MAREIALAARIRGDAVGATLCWYRYKYMPSLENSERQHPAPVATKVDVVPWVQWQSGGVTLAGRF
jgi:hypothetical protein